ncbi:MAG: hypothetical protein KC684_09990 [Candidatus Omnitrophica bacterium]|nr:hypothetical protein [Candidatus Omnitrophota bacterium]
MARPKIKVDVPEIDVTKKGLTERMRRLASMLKENPGTYINTNELLNYINANGDGGDPRNKISVVEQDTVTS